MKPHFYSQYVEILERELVPAMGCTEPIAIAYAASVARDELGTLPDEVNITVSANIIKNVKSVIVPNTNGLRGICAAAAAGIIAGKSELRLLVISQATEEQKKQIAAFLESTVFTVNEAPKDELFDITVRLKAGDKQSMCRINGDHTNIVRVENNGSSVLKKDVAKADTDGKKDDILTVSDIVKFADCLDINDVKNVIDRQIECNMAIAEEGIKNDYGARIGQILLSSRGTDTATKAKAMAAAASDARMGGCEKRVVINSGSGNQGITASVPVIVYARELGIGYDRLIRALAVSNLVTVHLKSNIGPLSAYCGATSAGCGAAAGITYLLGGGEKEVCHTIVNAIAINSGMICDGAKASCAAKIASAVEAGLLGMEMYRQGSQFYGGDGIVSKGVENTIANVGHVADGMKKTDSEIIKIMLGK